MARVTLPWGSKRWSPTPFIRPEASAKSTASAYHSLRGTSVKSFCGHSAANTPAPSENTSTSASASERMDLVSFMGDSSLV